MKTFWRIIGSLAALLVVAVIAGIIYFSMAFPKIGPAADVTISPTPEMLARGEYLFNHVAICVDCHSRRDPTKYAMPIKPGTHGAGGEDFAPFLNLSGTLQAPNLTPSTMKDWTDGEWFRAVTDGVNRDGEALFPMMPYPNYGTLDRSDIEALIAYAKTLAPIENQTAPRKLPFPLNIIVKTIPAPAAFKPRPDTTDLVAHGKYLVTMASCGECHTVRVKGEVIPGTEFAGGMEVELPFGIVRSVNITPDSTTGIGTWTQQEFIDKFKMYSPTDYVSPEVGENGANTIMPWIQYAGMSDYDLGAIYAYLRTVKPVSNLVERVSIKPDFVAPNEGSK